MLGASGAFPCLEFQIQSQTDNMISYFIKVANYKVTALSFLNYLFRLGWAKPDLWGLGGESWCILGSHHYAKIIPQSEDQFGIVKASYPPIHLR